MSYFTTYFESVDVSGLRNSINTCEDSLHRIRESSADISSFVGSGEWISDASGEVTSAMQRNDNRVNELCQKIETYVSVLSIVQEVIDKQRYMRSTALDEDQLKIYAKEIEQLVNRVIQTMRSI